MKIGIVVKQVGFGVLFVFICMSAGFAQHSKVYKNKALGYQLEYPADFTVKTIGSATVFSSMAEDRAFAFSPSVNVVAVDLGEAPADLAEFYKQSKDALERSLVTVKFLEDKKEKLAGISAYRLVYVSRQKKADFKFMQVMCIRNNRAYVVTYTALQEQYDKFLKTAQAIIKSFQLTAQ
jgi:eukaryotic-like serine/threonine-protein kinase